MAKVPGYSTQRNNINEAYKAGTITKEERDSFISDLKTFAEDGKLTAAERSAIGEEISLSAAPTPADDPVTTPSPEDDGSGTGSTRPPEPVVPGKKFYWDGQKWVAYDDPDYVDPNDQANKDADERQTRESAEAYLTSLLTQFGLEELIPTVSDLIKTWGTADNIIISKLRQTTAYQQRFAGNAMRTKNGYNAMSEAEYLSTEDAIKSTMRQYGLTADYYSRDKLATLIGGDVSATEVGDRVSQAKKVIDNADPNIKNSLVQMYGATMGDMLGYVLAPETALETLQRRVNAGFASGVALGQGIAMDTSLSEQIGDLTMGDERTLRAQFANVGDAARSTRRLSNIDNEDVTDTDVVKSSFGLDSTADTKIRKLQSRERARFSGQSSTGRSTLAGGGI